MRSGLKLLHRQQQQGGREMGCSSINNYKILQRIHGHVLLICCLQVYPENGAQAEMMVAAAMKVGATGTLSCIDQVLMLCEHECCDRTFLCTLSQAFTACVMGY